jgi:hypothetical protein
MNTGTQAADHRVVDTDVVATRVARVCTDLRASAGPATGQGIDRCPPEHNSLTEKGTRVFQTCVDVAALLGLLFASIARAEAPASQPAPALSSAAFRERLGELSRSLDRYHVDGDIRTHLFFRYADAPYTRATIACLLGAEQTLGEMSGRSGNGDRVPGSGFRVSRSASAPGPQHSPMPQSSALNPAIPSRSVARADAVFRWCDAAMARVRAGSPLESGTMDLGKRNAEHDAGMGWLASDSSPEDRDASLAAELDLVACLGAKAFVDARSGVTDPMAEAFGDRAEFLGVGYRRAGRDSAGSGPPLTAGDRCVALPARDYDPDAVQQWRAALWLRALGGERAMVFSLDGAWSRPWLLEATAHCGLDFLRLGEVLCHFPGSTDVALLVPNASPRSGEASAPGLRAGLCDALDDAQIPADVLGADAPGDADLLGRYGVLILAGLERVSPALRERIRRFRDAGNVLLAAGRCLTDVPRSGPGSIRFDLEVGIDSPGRLCGYVRRLRERGTVLAEQVIPVAPDGASLRGLRSGTARIEPGPGQFLVYLVNLTSTPLRFTLRYRGRTLTGRAEELVADQPVELTASPLALPPRGVWILRTAIPAR